MNPQNLPRLLIVGAGGHAKVIMDGLQAVRAHVVGVLDNDPARKGDLFMGAPILGGEELLPEIGLSGHATHFIIAVGAVGPADNRIRLFNAACAAGLIPLTIRAPGSMVSARAKIGAGSALLPCCVVNADASIGVNCIINTTAVIEHDCVVGDHVHVATGAKITGGAAVGIGSFVGAGAVVKHGVRIGARAVIGAGAVVVSDVPDNTTVVGCPARAVRNLK